MVHALLFGRVRDAGEIEQWVMPVVLPEHQRSLLLLQLLQDGILPLDGAGMFPHLPVLMGEGIWES